MPSFKLLQIAAELRARAAVASAAERADLLYLAEEYEASARNAATDKVGSFTVYMPK
jgi:hypothetical protein